MKKLLTFVLLIILLFQLPPLDASSLSKSPAASVRFLNKVTGKYEEKILKTNSLYIFDDQLYVILRACYKSSSQDEPENIAFFQVVKNIDKSVIVNNLEIPSDFKINRLDTTKRYSMIFTGWMFSSSPSLSVLEDNIYDVSIDKCTAE